SSSTTVTTSQTPQPTQTHDETANWVEYPLLIGDSQKAFMGITYKLPPSISKPAFVNAGHYYQSTRLPGNTTVAFIVTGNNLPFTMQWDGYKEMASLNGLS